MGVGVTALDGSHVEFDVSGELAQHGSIGVTLERRELTASIAGVFETMRSVAEATGGYRVLSIERHSLGSGTAILADIERRDLDFGREHWYDGITFGYWEGAKYALFLNHSSSIAALAALTELSYTEADSGLVIQRANSRPLNWLEPPSIVTEVPGVVQLEAIPLTKTTARRLPKQRGTRVRGGELFQDEFDSNVSADGSEIEHLHYFMLITDTALVTGVPVLGADEQQVIDIMAESTVVWS